MVNTRLVIYDYYKSRFIQLWKNIDNWNWSSLKFKWKDVWQFFGGKQDN